MLKGEARPIGPFIWLQENTLLFYFKAKGPRGVTAVPLTPKGRSPWILRRALPRSDFHIPRGHLEEWKSSDVHKDLKLEVNKLEPLTTIWMPRDRTMVRAGDTESLLGPGKWWRGRPGMVVPCW